MKPLPQSFDGLSKSWLLDLRARNRSPKTQYSYLLSARMLDDFTDKPLGDLTRSDVQAFIAHQLDTRSATTALVRFKSLQQFFRWALAEGEITSDPMVGMSPPSLPESVVPIVEEETIRALLKVCDGPLPEDRRDLALLWFFTDTGCRLGEVTGLYVSDINLMAGEAKVTGKGRRERIVPFGPRTAKALDRYLRVRRRHPHALTSDRLWLGPKGPMTESGLAQMLERRCRQAGVPKLHWHQFRHTLAHRWKAAGGSEDDLMRHAGWRSRAMVARYGASVAEERARETYRRLGLTDGI